MKNRIQCITVRRRCKSLCGHETGQKKSPPGGYREEIFYVQKTTRWGVVTGRRLLPETKEKKQK